MKLSGLFPAVATPTTSLGNVDYAMLDRLCDFLIDRGAQGLCIGGATAEYPHFEQAERLEMLRRVARRAPRGVTLVAAIGATGAAAVAAGVVLTLWLRRRTLRGQW